PTTVPVFASTTAAPRRLFACGSVFCHCQLDVPLGALLATVAIAPLRACPVWMASMSPQEAARLRIVNGILGFVTLIVFVRIICYCFDQLVDNCCMRVAALPYREAVFL